MNNLRKYWQYCLKNKAKLIKYLIIFLCFSFILSYLIFKHIDNTLILTDLENIENILKNTHINYLFYHFLVFSILFTFSFTGIGILLFPIYLVFETVSIWYNLWIFTKLYHLGGLFYSLIYIMLTKMLFFLFLLLIFKRLLNLIKIIFTKKDIDFRYAFLVNLKKIFIISLFLFLNDIFIYFLGNIILEKFLFLII